MRVLGGMGLLGAVAVGLLLEPAATAASAQPGPPPVPKLPDLPEVPVPAWHEWGQGLAFPGPSGEVYSPPTSTDRPTGAAALVVGLALLGARHRR